MKLLTGTLGPNLIAYFCLGITNATNNVSLKEGFVILWGTLRNFKTKFDTEALGEPCLESPKLI